MEYTRSIGDAYETFEGTPEEIAKLIKTVDQKEVLSNTMKDSAAEHEASLVKTGLSHFAPSKGGDS